MTQRDYIAMATTGISGSWARGPDRADTVKRAARAFKADHARLYKIPRGHVLNVNVYDVTGHDSLIIGPDGVVTEDGKHIPRLALDTYTL